MSSPEEQALHDRLVKHRGKIRKIHYHIGAGDGGPRMDVTLKDDSDKVLDQWNDWAIVGQSARGIVEGIVRTALGEKSILILRDQPRVCLNQLKLHGRTAAVENQNFHWEQSSEKHRRANAFCGTQSVDCTKGQFLLPPQSKHHHLNSATRE